MSRHRALLLVKGRAATMTTARYSQQPRRPLVAMRKAMLDAFLLALLTAVCLAIFDIALTHPFLSVLVIVLVFALVYVIAVVLRLRRAATNSPTAQSEWQIPVSHLNSRPLG